jgi:transposase
MYSVNIYCSVRRAVQVEGMSRREAARVYDLDVKTVRKMLSFSDPPGYQRKQPPKRPKLGPFTGFIDQILEDDKIQPRKQRHTAKRIFHRIRDEHGYSGGYTVVKDYVREKRLHLQETFVPLTHPPGHAQADFGEAWAFIGGVEQKIHFLVIDLPHSDTPFVKAYPRETTEAFCDGHNAAFTFFGGVPQSVLYDNTKLAVAKIKRDGQRTLTTEFTRLQSHYLFAERFGRPGKGNDKGKVEGMVGYIRRNFMVPKPRFNSFDELNAYLEEKCQERFKDRLRGHKETIGERYIRDQTALLPLPSTLYDASEKVPTEVNSQALVRYRSNDYSVPTRYGYHKVGVRGYIHEVIISCGTQEIARHVRSYDKEDVVFDPLHYLELLEQKPGALDQAAPLANWELPDEFDGLRRLLESRLGKKGKREYIQILRLLEVFKFQDVHIAIRDSIRLGAIGFDAVKHLVLCHIEHRPAQLDLALYPHLPQTQVKLTTAKDYNSLLSGAPS